MRILDYFDNEDFDNSDFDNLPVEEYYIRLFLEHIENKNIYFQYNKNEDIMNEEYDFLIDKCIDDIFDFETDFLYFCNKCGLYGHDISNKECLLWNEEYNTKSITEEVNFTKLPCDRKIIDTYKIS